MTVHIMFQYPVCVPSFISGHWLVFAVHLLTPKNDKKKKKKTKMTMMMMIMKSPSPSLYTKR